MLVHSFVVVHVHDVFFFRYSKPLMSGSPDVIISQCVLLFTHTVLRGTTLVLKVLRLWEKVSSIALTFKC